MPLPPTWVVRFSVLSSTYFATSTVSPGFAGGGAMPVLKKLSSLQAVGQPDPAGAGTPAGAAAALAMPQVANTVAITVRTARPTFPSGREMCPFWGAPADR